MMVRKTSGNVAILLRNRKKRFEEKKTSVAAINSVMLAPAKTALFIVPVDTTTKQMKISQL